MLFRRVYPPLVAATPSSQPAQPAPRTPACGPRDTLAALSATGAEQRLAVIDLGSNSFRLVVFTARDGWWKRTDEIYEAVRIGEGLAATGELGEAGMARAQATMEVFAHFCRAAGLGPDEVDAVATSAIRDARNAPEFLRRAEETSSLPVRVLSREEEARYGYLAAANSTKLADRVMLDLGGGSM